MKILYHHRLASKDGQYVHVDGVVDALRALGHEVIIAGPRLVEAQAFGGESGSVRWLKRWIPGATYELAEFGYSFLDYFRLSGAIRKHRPDFVYERYNLFFLSGLWARKRFQQPWLVEVNAPLFVERSAHGGIKLKRLARWSERSVWRGADHVFSVTRVLAQRIEREGVETDRITVTPNGIDIAAFDGLPSRAEAKQTLRLGETVVLGFTGFVRKWHGLERVLDGMQRLHVPSHFLVVGDGPARIAVVQRACELGLAASITFTGLVDRSRVLGYVNAFDIALQPDVVPYASPLKLFEYMAAGCAIVAPDRPNIREILTHGKNAWLFNADDPDSFAESVAKLVSDPALRQRLGVSAKTTIHEKHLTWRDNAERIVARARILVSHSNVNGPQTVLETGQDRD